MGSSRSAGPDHESSRAVWYGVRMTLGVLLVRWLIHAVVVMGSVALVFTVIVALVVTPFAFFWFLIVPGVIALICWILVFVIAYDIGIGQAIAVGIVQAAIGFLVDLFLIHGRLG